MGFFGGSSLGGSAFTMPLGSQDSTIIAVAHRLETVLDFDEVVVMEKGQVSDAAV